MDAAGLDVLMDVVPQPVPGVEVTTLAIDARDGFVLSQIDGQTAAGMLCELVGLQPDDLLAALRRLAAAGAIRWQPPASEPSARGAGRAPHRPVVPATTSAQGGEGHGATARRDSELEAALAEPGDLSRSERLHILAALRDHREKGFWVVLGLRGDPSAADIKRAYFAKSKQFHPDRYFGRDLGSFKPRLAEVFRGIKEAYDVLGDTARRSAYRAKHPSPPAEKAPTVDSAQRFRKRLGKPASTRAPALQLDPERRRSLEERREAIIDERRAKATQAPQEQLTRARELYELGGAQLGKDDLQGAAASFKLAAAFAPRNDEYRQRYDEIRVVAIKERTRELTEQANLEAATGRTREAARLYAEASDLAPAMCTFALRAAEHYKALGENHQALTYAERAVGVSPRRKEARVLAAEVLEELGDLPRAVSHLEVAVSLDKTDARVKKKLKRLSKA